jgi:DNA-binding beta-propeller fold protein YncE
VSTFAGGPTGLASGPVGSARFTSAAGVAVSADGATVYLTDQGNHRIVSIVSGVVTTVAGSSAGVQGFQDGAASSALFTQPGGIVVDAAGGIIVSEMSPNFRVRRIFGGVVSTLAGNGDTLAYQDGVGTNAYFRQPYGLAVTGAPTSLYIADRCNL